MPKPPAPSPVLHIRQDGSWTLKTDNLQKLRRTLGDGVLNGFIRAFIHAERLDALVSLERLNLKHLQADQGQLRRNHLVFLFFLVGTMKELATCLDALRSALATNGLLDPKEWTRLLGSWDQDWRTDPAVTAVRNRAAFHVDRTLIDAGLDTFSPNKPAEIFRGGDRSLTPDGAFPLGDTALISGLGLTNSELTALFSRPIKDFGVPVALMLLLKSTLARAGVPPRVRN